MKSGQTVTVSDGSGKLLATGTTGIGKLPIQGEYTTVTCVIPITVADVPKADFYKIQVGHRGEMTYSYDDLEAQGWQLGLSLS